MSRVGKQPIAIPSGVDVKVVDGTVSAKGPKGELSYTLVEGISISIESGTASVTPLGTDRTARSLHGLSRTMVANLVEGVSKGFSKSLEIQGTGYRAQVQGQKVVLNLGYSHPIDFELPAGISAAVEGNKLTITGIDKYMVGEVAARIRRLRPPEPYKGKGVRYVGEHVRRKAGKSAGS